MQTIIRAPRTAWSAPVVIWQNFVVVLPPPDFPLSVSAIFQQRVDDSAVVQESGSELAEIVYPLGTALIEWHSIPQRCTSFRHFFIIIYRFGSIPDHVINSHKTRRKALVRLCFNLPRALASSSNATVTGLKTSNSAALSKLQPSASHACSCWPVGTSSGVDASSCILRNQ